MPINKKKVQPKWQYGKFQSQRKSSGMGSKEYVVENESVVEEESVRDVILKVVENLISETVNTVNLMVSFAFIQFKA